MLDGLDTGEKGALVSSVGFAVLVLMSLIPRLRGIGFARSLQMALGWIVIFGGLILLVAQWPAIRGAVDPAAPVSSASEVRVTARDDGHFYVRARVNGDDVLFMVDTGATDIVLTRATAARLGFTGLVYDGVAATANADVRVAGVRLDRLDVGGIRLDNVPASVNAGALGENLLGMRFLNALPGWRVENGTLILSMI
jgi:aspartyl protease family protein